jgi:hypothetical protein
MDEGNCSGPLTILIDVELSLLFRDRAARGDVLLVDLDRRLIPEGGLAHEEFVE